MRAHDYRHEFVEFIPENLDQGVVYVSMSYATAVHCCFCGCGAKVVTPITPTDWQLKFDGNSVSLDPSVGSWSLTCRSHYWLTDGEVVWAGQWSKAMIDRERARDLRDKQEYYSRSHPSGSTSLTAESRAPTTGRSITKFLRRAAKYLLRQSDQ